MPGRTSTQHGTKRQVTAAKQAGKAASRRCHARQLPSAMWQRLPRTKTPPAPLSPSALPLFAPRPASSLPSPPPPSSSSITSATFGPPYGAHTLRKRSARVPGLLRPHKCDEVPGCATAESRAPSTAEGRACVCARKKKKRKRGLANGERTRLRLRLPLPSGPGRIGRSARHVHHPAAHVGVAQRRLAHHQHRRARGGQQPQLRHVDAAPAPARDRRGRRPPSSPGRLGSCCAAATPRAPARLPRDACVQRLRGRQGASHLLCLGGGGRETLPAVRGGV